MSNEHQPGSPGVDLDALDELHRAVSPAPWEADSIDSDGFKARAMYSNGKSVFDSLNSESATVEEDNDGEVAGYVHRWDSTARADFEFIAAMRNTYAPMAAELRTMRARVGELEAMNRSQVDKLAAVERLLGAEADKLEERAEAAEARLKELEASIARIHSFAGRGDGHGSLAATEACLADTFTMLRIDYDNAAKEAEADAARITDLESQLAAAREEQGLEAQLRKLPAFDTLTVAVRFDDERSWIAEWERPGEAIEYATAAPSLPALLRAILEVEAKGC